MSTELVPVGPVIEGEVWETEPDVFVEEYVDVFTADERQVSTPLEEADEEALAQGIASVFESLRSDPEGDEVEGDEGDPTFALLAELNRLWAEPLAA